MTFPSCSCCSQQGFQGFPSISASKEIFLHAFLHADKTQNPQALAERSMKTVFVIYILVDVNNGHSRQEMLRVQPFDQAMEGCNCCTLLAVKVEETPLYVKSLDKEKGEEKHGSFLLMKGKVVLQPRIEKPSAMFKRVIEEAFFISLKKEHVRMLICVSLTNELHCLLTDKAAGKEGTSWCVRSKYLDIFLFEYCLLSQKTNPARGCSEWKNDGGEEVISFFTILPFHTGGPTSTCVMEVVGEHSNGLYPRVHTCKLNGPPVHAENSHFGVQDTLHVSRGRVGLFSFKICIYEKAEERRFCLLSHMVLQLTDKSLCSKCPSDNKAAHSSRQGKDATFCFFSADFKEESGFVFLPAFSTFSRTKTFASCVHRTTRERFSQDKEKGHPCTAFRQILIHAWLMIKATVSLGPLVNAYVPQFKAHDMLLMGCFSAEFKGWKLPHMSVDDKESHSLDVSQWRDLMVHGVLIQKARYLSKGIQQSEDIMKKGMHVPLAKPFITFLEILFKRQRGLFRMIEDPLGLEITFHEKGAFLTCPLLAAHAQEQEIFWKIANKLTLSKRIFNASWSIYWTFGHVKGLRSFSLFC